MSEDKVRTKDSCWSVGTIYDPSELPEVSTAGTVIKRGVSVLQSCLPLARLQLTYYPTN